MNPSVAIRTDMARLIRNKPANRLSGFWGHWRCLSKRGLSMLGDSMFGLSMMFMIASRLVAMQPPADQPQGPPLSPAESSLQFSVPNEWQWEACLTEPTISQPLMVHFDVRGRMWLVEYLQYPAPAGLKPLSRDNFWRIVYDQTPLPPGHGGVPGADRITIHEDRDGDGSLETHQAFLEGLNIATSVVSVRQGAWVLNPPYLLFYPDLDDDGKADGSPEVHLEGFGLEDTHSVVNNLCLGPDGWLYAAQGSTVTASVHQPGSKSAPTKSLGQAIWRYHPQTREYEIFAEGGGNAFGVAFDDQGRIFSGHNGGDTRGFHYVQGGYYRKGFTKHGSLSNPYTFGFLEPMKHPSVQRFTHTMLMTQGTSLASEKGGQLLAVDPLHGKLIDTFLKPRGSTFETEEGTRSLASQDKWFRPVAIHSGPDGAAYVCDWYDSQVAHLYAHVGKLDREHGRVYRLAGKAHAEAPAWQPQRALDSGPDGVQYLFATLAHPFRWQRWKAIELLAEHPLRNHVAPQLAAQIQANADHSLELLWTAHRCGWLAGTIPYPQSTSEAANPVATLPGASSDDQQATTKVVSLSEARQAFAKHQAFAEHPNPHVRSWWVRLVGDDRALEEDQVATIQALAAKETDPEVLSQILCTAKRLPAREAYVILATWLTNPSANQQIAQGDPHLPHLLWWAFETHADDAERLFAWLSSDENVWEQAVLAERLIPHWVQRWSLQNDATSWRNVAQLLRWIEAKPQPLRQRWGQFAIQGLEKSFEGRMTFGIDAELLRILKAIGDLPLSFRLRTGDSAAIQEAASLLLDKRTPIQQRIHLARLAGERQQSAFWPALMEAVNSSPQSKEEIELQGIALASLSSYVDHPVSEVLIQRWPHLQAESLVNAAVTLASRPQWTLDWFAACREGKCQIETLPLEGQRAMRFHSNPAIDRELNSHFPMPGNLTLEEAQAKTVSLAELIREGNGDPYNGKKIYQERCGRCHRLFDQGGQIGPDLTGYQRDMLETLLRNTIAPSLEIREGYQAMAAMLDDGQVIVGVVEQQSEDTLVLRGVDAQSHSLDRKELLSLQPQPQSLMPEGLLDSLSPQALRDLFGYLRSSQPLFDENQ